jgi:hypothetical protein
LQNYQINITVAAMLEEEAKEREKSGVVFEIIGDRSKLNPKEEVPDSGKDGPSTSASSLKSEFFTVSRLSI